MNAVARVGFETPLVGRDRELRVLTAALDQARRGQPGLVLVGGDAGVGKTRLLIEFVAQAEQAGRPS